MSVIQSSQHTDSLTTILQRPSCQLTVRVCSEYRKRRHRRASICRAESGFINSSSWDSRLPKKQKQVVTLLTTDGFVTLPSWSEVAEVPRRVRLEQPPLPTADEQGLCLGACFTIAATNGADPSRRLSILGFCRSVDDLSEVVEDAVLSRGGKIVLNQIELKSGLHEILKMTVAIPLLNGVPPQHEYLRSAISSGGGIVERMYRQWQMYG